MSSIRRSGPRFAVSWGALSPGDLNPPPPLPLCFLSLSLSPYCCYFFVAFASLADSLFMLLCTHTIFLFFLFPFPLTSSSSTSATFHSPPLMPILTVNRVLSPHSSLTDDDWGVMGNLLRRMTMMGMGRAEEEGREVIIILHTCH